MQTLTPDAYASLRDGAEVVTWDEFGDKVVEKLKAMPVG